MRTQKKWNWFSSNSDAPIAKTTIKEEKVVVDVFETQNPFNQLFIFYASLAGCCGALSGVVGKMAVASTSVVEFAKFIGFVDSNYSPNSQNEEGENYWGIVTWILLLLRVLFLVSNAVFTAQMWRYYVKSLSLGPTAVCQIINTGTNFAVSAFIGIVFFGEQVNAMWAFGALLVVLGLALVVSSRR